MTANNKMTKEQIKKEIDKCLEEPWYFYNQYIKHPTQPLMTKERWKAMKFIKRKTRY